MGRAAEMRIELTGYDRPARLACRAIMRQADMDGTFTFEPALSGTRMRWSWHVRPKAVVRLMAPADHVAGPSPGAGHLGQREAVSGEYRGCLVAGRGSGRFRRAVPDLVGEEGQHPLPGVGGRGRARSCATGR
jgi:hypothetical protein